MKQLKKFDRDKVDDILCELELSDKLLLTLKLYETDVEKIYFLLDNAQLEAGVKYLSLGMPKPESIWWAYLNAYEVEGEKDCLKTQGALKTVYQWVHEPSEKARYQAESYAESLLLYTPSSWAAMSVFWSGESIAPPGKPAVTPSEFMSGHAVANSIICAASLAQERKAFLKHAIKQGLHVAMGGNGRI